MKMIGSIKYTDLVQSVQRDMSCLGETLLRPVQEPGALTGGPARLASSRLLAVAGIIRRRLEAGFGGCYTYPKLASCVSISCFSIAPRTISVGSY